MFLLEILIFQSHLWVDDVFPHVFENLKLIDLSNNNISRIEGLENLIGLKELNLDNNQIIEIEGLENLIELESLNLSNNQITKICGLENLIKLRELDLRNNLLTSYPKELEVIVSNLYIKEGNPIEKYTLGKIEDIIMGMEIVLPLGDVYND